MWLLKLIGGVPPGLKEGIGEQTIAHDTSSQFVSQDTLAPCSIQKPVVGHIMIVANHVGSNVRQCSAHLGKCRAKVLQLLHFAGILLLLLRLVLGGVRGFRVGGAILWKR